MTITFFSNFLNSHQLPLCEAIIERVGVENFKFVATTKIAQDRADLGFVDMNEKYPFVLKAYNSKEELAESYKLAETSDVAIIGSASYRYSDVRMKNNLLTFNYTERVLKKGKWMLLYPPKFIRALHFYTYTRNKPNYVLGASAYTKDDVAFCGFPKSKCYKWGYFPEIKTFDNVEYLFSQKDKLKNRDISIIWVARLIEWKHPEHAIYLAHKLKNEGFKFRLDMIGVGPLLNQCKKMIHKYDLEEYVRMVGGLTPEEVRSRMAKSDIFIFTSDKNEGWGAVLNEAMSSACAVVANKAIGSVPFLIKDGLNGFTYSNDLNEAYDKLKRVILDGNLRRQLGVNAYNTIIKEWNANQAAENLFVLIQCLKEGMDCPIQDGPCSKA